MQNKQGTSKGIKNRSFLEVGKIYLCRDTQVRKITGLEKGVFSYILGDPDTMKIRWRSGGDVSRTLTNLCLKGVVIESEAALLRCYRQQKIASLQVYIGGLADEIEWHKDEIAQLQNLDNKDGLKND